MSDPKDDLWSEFADDEPQDGASANEPAAPKKSTAKDGSEWQGAFDRRATPRDDATDSHSDDQADAA